MKESISIRRQILSQLLALAILVIVLFPVLWIVSMAIDPRNVSRPTSLLPAGASLRAFRAVLTQPTPNPVSFLELARNSSILAVGVSALTVLVGTTAAYAFSRFRFPGREIGMVSFILVPIAPTVATVTPLFVLLNIVWASLRNSIMGVGLAMIATSLPFAIWNMKGFIDTIPKELEEAALLDGASPNQTFYRIMLPLALPGLAVTALWGFMAGWTEFILSWQFIFDPGSVILCIALYGMQVQTRANTRGPSSTGHGALLVSLPVVVVFFVLQRYIVSGLTIGGVKGRPCGLWCCWWLSPANISRRMPMAISICLLRARHSTPMISKLGWETGSMSLRAGAPAIASGMAGVISPIMALGTSTVIGARMTSASPMETRMAVSAAGAAAGAGPHHLYPSPGRWCPGR